MALGPNASLISQQALRRFRAWAALAFALTVAGCGIDLDQVRVCQRLIPAFEKHPESVEILRHEHHGSAKNSIVVHYRSRDDENGSSEHWVACWFGGTMFGSGRLTLEGVSTDRRDLLSPVQFQMLQIWMRIAGPDAVPVDRERGPYDPSASDGLYLLQSLVNALAKSSVYVMVAIGFTLVYGVINRLNLALGEISTIAAYGAFIGMTVLAAAGTGWFGAGLLLVLVVALAISALFNVVTERLVFRPLRGASTQAPLIATIGLAIFLREFMRLAQGSRDRWLQPMTAEAYPIAGGDGFSVSISPGQVIIVGLTVALCCALGLLMMRSSFGRHYRACCDDFRMAALLGVHVDRTVAATFALSAVFAGTAGVMMVLYYGTVAAYMGVVIGFKALVAAVVGGIGSIAGAIVGGVVIGLVESLWSAYFTGAYRDIIVFGLLAAMLVFRPNGLLGRTSARGD
jgi:branched-chain amino acid transport system permease protein